MRTFGLIGKTLGHSFSKGFFTEKFSAEKIEAQYLNFELNEISEIETLFENNSLSGLNVTVPYKQAIIPYLDGLSDTALAIGAVNVIAFEDGKKIGHNTDAFGFQQSIKPFLTNDHERALILGTGGASKAVAHVFQSLGIEVIWISRTPEGEFQFSYDDINVHMLRSCKVIVNCTPIGTFPNIDACVPFPFEFLTPEHLCIDLIYNPAETTFLRLSREQHATTLNGYSMLKEQALKSWDIWNSNPA